MSDTRELTATELEALAAKLDALDLNDAERELLLAVFDAVVDPSGWVGADVRGFGILVDLEGGLARVDDPRPSFRGFESTERLSTSFLKLFGR